MDESRTAFGPFSSLWISAGRRLTMHELYRNDSFPKSEVAAACASVVARIEAAPLGIYASSITRKSCKSDVEVREAVAVHRTERFRLLSVARLLLMAAGRAAGLPYWHDYHRTAKCKLVRRADYVGVHLAPEFNGAFFTGLVTCGSLWVCPVCAAKIQERRRAEIAQAIDWAYASDLQPVMVTLTFPHQAWHKLSRLLEQQAVALQRLRAGQPWKRFKRSIGFQGMIRALELTHGDAGWHPHTHEIWFVKKTADAEVMKKEIVLRWESACRRAGLMPNGSVAGFREHSVDVKGNCSASDYLAKQDDSRHWGADRELAKSSTKAGRAKGLHPFGLLANAADGNRRAGRLFLVYAIATKGRRQLFWTKGLKRRVSLRDLSDEVIAEQEREPADLLGMLSPADWDRVCGAQARAQLLQAAEKGKWRAVQQLLDSC